MTYYPQPPADAFSLRNRAIHSGTQAISTIEGLQSNITTLQSNITTAQSDVTALQGNVATSQSNITVLQGEGSTYVRNVAAWGVLPSASGSANSAAMNQAIQDAYNGGYGLIVDPGLYYFASTILIAKISAGAWVKTQAPSISSSVYNPVPRGYTGGQLFFPWFISQFDDAPLVSMQSVIGATIKGIHLQGSHNPCNSTEFNAASVVSTLSDSTLWDYGGGANWNNRYRPPCVIAIDPFGTISNAARYAGVPSSYYTMANGFSSGVVIEDCTLSDSSVGLMVGCGVDSNTDEIYVDRTKFWNLKTGYSSCHAQQVEAIMKGCTFARCWTGLTNNTHGAQNGYIPHIISMAPSYWMGRIFGTLHPGSAIWLSGGEYEIIGQIGDFFPANGDYLPVNIENCRFNSLRTRTDGAPHIKSGRAFKMKSCTLYCDDGPVTIRVDSSEDLPATFDSTGYYGTIATNQLEFADIRFAGFNQATLAGVLTVGAGTANARNWAKFSNCYCNVNAVLKMIHGRAETLSLPTPP